MSGGSAGRYEFPPLERRGVILGLRAGPLATLGGGALVAVGVLRALPGAAGMAAAAATAVAVAALACWPVAGQPPVSWLPTVLAWAGRRRNQPRLDATPLEGTDAGRRAPAFPVPSPVAPVGLRLVDAHAVPGEAPIGVVEDRAARTWSAVVPVTGPPLGLLDPEEQAGRLGAWGAVLAGVARPGSGVRRLQWLEGCRPADPGPLQQAAEAADGLDAACAGYRRTVALEAPGTLSHQTFLVVAVTAATSRWRPVRACAANELLRRELRLLAAQLRAADLDVAAPLDPPALRAVLCAAHDPTRPAAVVPGDALHASPVAGAWPAATDERWGSVRVDDNWQATFWVSEWPRLPVGPDALMPLLAGGAARTVSVTMAPVPAERAVREIHSARTAALADDALRSRAGFIDTARRQREIEGVRRREAELADGHADFRYSGYVTVAGRTSEELEQACAEVEQSARQAHLVLRRLYGRQAEARTWTLPLGRGLS